MNTTVTSGTNTPLELFGRTYASSKALTPESVSEIYGQLSPEGKQQADALQEIAGVFVEVVQLKPKNMSMSAWLDSLKNTSQAADRGLGPAFQDAVAKARELLETIPTVRSAMQGAENMGTIANLATAPLQFASALISDGAAIFNLATTDAALSEEEARRFAVVYMAAHQTAKAKLEAAYNAMPNNGITRDGITSRQEEYLGQYALARGESVYNRILHNIPFVAEIVAGVKAAWHAVTNWDFGSFGEVYRKKLRELKEYSQTPVDTQQAFDARVREGFDRDASRDASQMLRGFFGKESPEGQLAGVVESGGQVITPAGNEVPVEAGGRTAEGTDYQWKTPAILSNLASGVVSAVNPDNYESKLGYAFGLSVLGVGGLGAAQGAAQTFNRFMPDTAIGQQSARFMAATGLGKDASGFAKVANFLNPARWVSKITGYSIGGLGYISALAIEKTWSGISAVAGSVVDTVSDTARAASSAASLSDDLAAGAAQRRAAEAASDAMKAGDTISDATKAAAALADVATPATQTVIRAAKPVGLMSRLLSPLARFARPIPLVGAAGAGFLVYGATASASAAEGGNLSCWDLLDQDYAAGKITEDEFNQLRALQLAYAGAGAGGFVTGIASEGTHHALLDDVSSINPKLIERYLPETITQSLENLGRAIVPESVTSGLVRATESTVSAAQYLHYRFNPFAADVGDKLSELASSNDATLRRYMDANLDGTLTGEEIEQHLTRYGVIPANVNAMDRDGDGHITSHDIYTAMKEGHRTHGVERALMAEASNYEMRARNAALQASGSLAISGTTAHLGAVSVDDGSVGSIKPPANPTGTDVAATLFGTPTPAPRTLS